MCSGHGKCNPVNICECYSAWEGGDCSQRKCPFGKAWADIAIADDMAHQPIECSGAGTCDRTTGKCQCFAGYEGGACDRLSCPNKGCGDHGRCMTMKSYATTVDAGLMIPGAPYTNVRTPYLYATPWDADMIQGCACDSGFEGYDCNRRSCPVGDDPLTTGQDNEVQLISCTINPLSMPGATIRLSFRGAISRALPLTASPIDFHTALEELPTISRVSVSYSALNEFCRAADGIAGENVATVTFLDQHGELPRIVILNEKGRPLYGALDNFITVATKGESIFALRDTVTGGTNEFISVKGTKEAVVCSNRGACDHRTGVCHCYTGFTSSNGQGQPGNYPDCGYAYLPITDCPGRKGIPCSGHGTCNYSSYTCECDRGWGDGDCSRRTCAMGPAWFDYPSDNNEAHALAECSNRGTCNPNTGLCQCDSNFEGEACERMSCPGKGTPAGECSGNGVCLTMAQLAKYNRINGDPEPVEYGSQYGNPLTWDENSVRGCLCDEGFTGPDCSQKLCPFGEDITLVEADPSRLAEIQLLSCQYTVAPFISVYFRLSFRGEETVNIPWDATMDEVQSALNDLSSILGHIDIEYRPYSTNPNPAIDQFCTDAAFPQYAVFAFRTTRGDVPPIRVVMDELTKSPVTGQYGEGLGFLGTELTFVGGDPLLNYKQDPQAAAPAEEPIYVFSNGLGEYELGGIRTFEFRQGSTGWDECSKRGICDRSIGQCKCFLGFGSSNMLRASGLIENCGYREPHQYAQAQWMKANGHLA